MSQETEANNVRAGQDLQLNPEVAVEIIGAVSAETNLNQLLTGAEQYQPLEHSLALSERVWSDERDLEHALTVKMGRWAEIILLQNQCKKITSDIFDKNVREQLIAKTDGVIIAMFVKLIQAVLAQNTQVIQVDKREHFVRILIRDGVQHAFRDRVTAACITLKLIRAEETPQIETETNTEEKAKEQLRHSILLHVVAIQQNLEGKNDPSLKEALHAAFGVNSSASQLRSLGFTQLVALFEKLQAIVADKNIPVLDTAELILNTLQRNIKK